MTDFPLGEKVGRVQVTALPLVLSFATLVLTLVLGGWGLYCFALQNGKLLLRVEELERLLARGGLPLQSQVTPDAETEVAGNPPLEIGTIGNDFDLPNLWGGRRTLSDELGKRVLLLFVDPTCPFSRDLLGTMAAAAASPHPSGSQLLIVTTGEAEANRQLLEPLSSRAPAVLQDDWELGLLYHVPGTPSGYLLDERGAVISGMGLGIEAMLALGAGSAAPVEPVPAVLAAGPFTSHSTSGFYSGGPGPGDLAVGVAAPAFTLPRLDGGLVALSEYRRRRLLLVFTDPLCQACERVAPELERLHQTQGAPAVLAVSRRDPETNRAFVAAHALTYPVVLQQYWEISLQYKGMAAPVAYLIDEEGRIASNAARGAAKVLALVSSAGAGATT